MLSKTFSSRPSPAFCGLIAAIGGIMLCAPLWAHDFADSAVKLRAIGTNGTESYGSAVVVASDTLATACHVTRDARFIEVSHEGKVWTAGPQTGSPAHDVCLLSVPHLGLPAVRIRSAASLMAGERVVAAGFPGGGALEAQTGAIEALYPYEGGMVIRTSATFASGASGGGLFDTHGQLVGLLAFRARSGERLHFALPAEWLLPDSAIAARLGPLDASAVPIAFWERPKTEQPAFLRQSLVETASRR